VQQLGIGYGVIALSAYLLLLFLMVFSLDAWIWFPFWLGLGRGLHDRTRCHRLERGRGWRARFLAARLFPELFFDMFLNIVYVKGIIDISLGRTANWKHVTHTHFAGAVKEPA
jgi:hypothetical protein